MNMKKSDVNPLPGFFDRYINLVEEEGLFEALIQSKELVDGLDKNKLLGLGDKVYAPGKWTIKDIFQHIIDTERILTYRALRFARTDQTLLPGYDEELYGKTSLAINRALEDILDELLIVRESSIRLFKSFDISVMQNSGICFHQKISVVALGFVVAGHQHHHLRVIKERYMPLLENPVHL